MSDTISVLKTARREARNRYLAALDRVQCFNPDPADKAEFDAASEAFDTATAALSAAEEDSYTSPIVGEYYDTYNTLNRQS